MPLPKTPKKEKPTKARTVDPEPMKGLTPEKPGFVTPKKDEEDYSPVKEVDLGEDLTSSQKSEMAEIGSRQEQFRKAMTTAGRKSRKHKKSRKTRKVKKHGKRKH